MADSLLHTCQSKTFCHFFLRGRKAAPLISDGELEVLFRSVQIHYHVIDSAVFRSVLKRFLSDSEYAERNIPIERFGNLAAKKIDLDPAAPREFSAEASERRDESQVLELRRMELV